MSEHKLGSKGSNGLITELSLPRAQKAHIPLGYEPEPRPNELIPGWFTKEQWGQLKPYVQSLISKPAGVLLLAVTIQPERRNYPEVAFAVFNAGERVALRRALEAARKRRIKLMQDTKSSRYVAAFVSESQRLRTCNDESLQLTECE
jgi:hypothetical protein